MKPASNQLHSFFFFWSFAASVHMSSHWAAHPVTAAAFALNLFVLLFPEKLSFVACASLAQIAALFVELPAADNHFVLMGFVNLALLGTILSSSFFRSKAHERFQYFVTAGQLSLAALYLFAVFHKLNLDFFNPEVSCVGTLMDRIISRISNGKIVGPAEEAPVQFGIVMTLLIESAIPILLFTRFKKFGLALGFIFHTGMGMIGVYRFSTVVFALYTLFFLGSEKRKITFPLRLCFVLYLLAISYLSREQELRSYKMYSLAVQNLEFIAWLALSCVFFYPYLSMKLQDSRLGWMGALNALILCLIVINGMAPYLGFKTIGSFTMYSNLRTEDKFSNHFIIPAQLLRVVDYEDDVVQILPGSSPYFNSWIYSGKKIPYFEFQAYMNEIANSPQANVSIRYQRGEGTYFVPHISEKEEFSKAPPTLLRKLIAFHPVMPKEKAQVCQW